MMLDLQRWLAPDVAVVGHVLPDVIGEALPLFFLLIAVEVVAAWRSRRQLYSLRQTISNLSAGSLSVTLGEGQGGARAGGCKAWGETRPARTLADSGVHGWRLPCCSGASFGRA